MPDTTPTAAPAAPAPAAPVAEDRHPGVSKLLDILISDTAPEENDEKRAAPEKKPAPAAPTAPVAAAPAAPADKPITVRKRPAAPAPARPALPIDTPAAPAAPAARAAATPPAAEEAIELLPNEIQDQADAEFAERHMGAEYAGLGAKVKKFHRDHAAYTSRPDFEPDSPEYKEWLAANQPKLTPVQQRAIMEAQFTQKADERARSQVGQVEHKLFVRDTEPLVKQEGDKVYAELADLALPKEIRDILAEPQFAKDPNAAWAEAKKYHQLEIQTAHNVISAFKGDVEELQRISRKHPATGQPMVAEAVLASDPRFVQHQRIRNLVADMCEDFKKSGEAQQKPDGRWFVTREEYGKLPAAHRANYWTFSNSDVIARAKGKIPSVVSQTIQRQLAEQTARGFIRQPRPAPAAPAAKSAPGAPPAPRPSAIPSGGGGGVESMGAKLAGALSGSR